MVKDAAQYLFEIFLKCHITVMNNCVESWTGFYTSHCPCFALGRTTMHSVCLSDSAGLPTSVKGIPEIEIYVDWRYLDPGQTTIDCVRLES